MKYKKKTDYTDMQIKNSFIKLLENKPFEKITVNNILEDIHISRSTFYRYYDDKYNLISKIEAELINQIKMNRERKKQDKILLKSNMKDNIFEGIKFCDKHFKEFHALLGENGDPNFEHKLEDSFTEFYKGNIKFSGLEAELIRITFVTISLKILKYWIFNRDEISVEELSIIADNLFSEGPINYFKKLQTSKL